MMKTVAQKNDIFRQTMIPCSWAKIMLTEGVRESEQREAIITAVREFKDFNESNDPHQEHDFGKVEVDGVSYFFKFDYYDKSLTYGEDPKTGKAIHVLTIMRADEY